MGRFIIKSDRLYPLRHSSVTISQSPKKDIIKIATEIFGVMFGFRRKGRKQIVDAGTCTDSSS